TLFLDEIGEIDAPTQVKLLRFLESRAFERLGSTKSIQVDVRLVCATNRDLFKMVGENTFREDLYYRLNVVPVHLPPLRVRRDDIPVLLHHFLGQFAEENGMPAPEILPDALQALSHYPWPGNIRELRNLCENLVVTRRGGQVSAYDLDPRFTDPAAAEQMRRSGDAGASTPPRDPGPGSLSREENEKRLLRKALRETGGNRTRAAELLGISRRTLHRKLVQWPELDTAG
ncbi:MAG: sigma 54-interacting transcriptional regulator, partial [Opitutales bacterium]